MSIASLRRSSSEAAFKIDNFMKAQNRGSGPSDEGVWKIYLDEDKGVGQAVIRFLPAPEGEDLPIAKVLHYNFKNPQNGKWYINNCRVTLGDWEDPVWLLSKRLKSSGLESDIKARELVKMKTDYWTNILVISDPARPENEGKVFRYKFGPAIYKMLEAQMSPQFEDVKPINPFDMWNGSTLKLRVYRDGPKGKGYWKYDRSMWDEPSEIFVDDDSAKEAIWAQCKSLSAYTDQSKFKSNSELAAKLVEVLGTTYGSVETVEGISKSLLPVDVGTNSNSVNQARTESVVTSPSEHKFSVAHESFTSDGDNVDDDFEYFTRVASGG